MGWLTASIWIAGFAFACLAVCGWAMFRSTSGRGPGDSLEFDKALAAHQAELLRSLEGLRAEMVELRSQVSDVQRVLREVG
jgi:hypothetical protein